MTAIEWFDALQWIHIVLIVAVLLLFVGYIYLIKKVTQLQYVGGFIGKRKIRVFGILFGSLVVFYLFYNLHKLQPNEWVEISLLAGLVAATGALALYAAGQAHTSVEMAEEIKKQRYNAIRPVLDIKKTDTLELSEESKTTNLGLLMEVAKGNIPPFIYCSIYNVGLGTALDTYTEIDFNGEIFPRHYLGTITCGENRNPLPLRVKKEDEHHVLTVTYKDMYGRDIKSSREVLVQNHSIELGPIHIIVNGESKEND